MEKATRIFAWITGILFSVGIISKIMHWPGASMEFVLATFSFIFFYLPLWLIESLRAKEFKFFYWTQFFLLTAFMLGFLFKFQHWPGAGAVVYLMYFILLFLFLPAYIFKIRKTASGAKSSVHIILCFTLIIGTFYFYQVGQVSKGMMATMDLGSMRTEQMIEKANIKSRKLYEAFDVFENKEKLSEYQKSLEIKRLSDEMIFYIRKVRANVVSKCERISIKEADTLKAENIYNKSNYDIPTLILIGNEESEPSKGSELPLSAFELKEKLDSFKLSVLNLFEEQQRKVLSDAITIETDDVINEENGEKIKSSWEAHNFDHVPLTVVLNTLASLQYEVKNTEINILTQLLSDASIKNKENLAAQLADLGAKYESQKKEQEIALLKKDQELFDTRIKEKNEDLNSARDTIAFFSVAIAAFLVLLFFVVRSSMLRKQLNKDLETQKLKVEEAYEELHQQNEEIAAQRDEIEKQKHKVEEHQQEIIDSLNYAKRLQQAILPPLNHIQQFIPETFILYKPKDIVAGDFYWFEEKGDFIYLAAADCTGHGVPGAMVSVVCSNALNRALTEFNKTETGTLLDKVRELVVSTFEKSGEEVKDGMDISLIRIEKRDLRIENADTEIKIQWSGANNPLWYIPSVIASFPILHGNDEPILASIKADKQPIGKYAEEKPFITNTVNIPKGSTLYLFTDGYADQFGGPKGKKFKYKQLEELLVEIHTKPMQEQSEILDQRFMEWKGGLEQIDDVCVIGIKL